MDNTFALQHIYFTDIKFHQVRGYNGKINLQINNNFNFARANDKKSIKVTYDCNVTSEETYLSLSLKLEGIFLINEETEMNNELAQAMINVIHPYMRNQVQLSTTQPGIVPIILPLSFPKIELNKENVIYA